jgi:hypothetical protein
MDSGLFYFPLNGRVVPSEALLEIYEAHCKAHKTAPNSNIEGILARADSEVLGGIAEFTNNFAPWQKFHVGKVGDFLYVQGVNHALSPKNHQIGDRQLAIDTQFVLENMQ